MDTTSFMDVGTYIYCIARAEPFADSAAPILAKSIGGPGYPVYTVRFMDLVAIVSDSPAARYDVGRQNTLAHQRVIEEVMSRSEVLPVRFNTIAKSQQQIQDRLLKRKFGELHYLLRHVRGRAELGLKVFWNRERLFADIASESAQIRALRDTIAGKSPEETHYQRIQLGQLIEETIIRKRDEDADAIVQVLRPLAFETKVNKILTDMMVLNAAFLVAENNGQAFDAKVNELDDTQQGRLILKYVGPLPPYNFVNVVVHWDEE
ncbi:MAG: GvpL/GvpF family gas vesicle protein [Chloroflexota bacterium]|nr:MAG: GvpL/GvpF family gas vesicle protein [Chloroflexota bacterium]